MMPRVCHILAGLTLAFFANAPAGAQQLDAPAFADLIDSTWGTDPLWDDGQAESATYAAERIIYGELRPHILRLLTVKEDFTTEYWTKADWPYGDKPILTVLKQHRVATVETPNYPYHFATSTFFARDEIGRMVKMVTSSQEWCGITTKEYQLHTDPPQFAYSSYWEGEGTGSEPIRDFVGENTFFEEELPLLVRALTHEDGQQAWLRLAPEQVGNKAPVPRPVVARASVARESRTIEVPAGTFESGTLWRVRFDAEDGRVLVFHVTAEAPQTLIRFEANDGRVWRLETAERRRYWVRGE